jgi:hypothetical protein
MVSAWYLQSKPLFLIVAGGGLATLAALHVTERYLSKHAGDLPFQLSVYSFGALSVLNSSVSEWFEKVTSHLPKNFFYRVTNGRDIVPTLSPFKHVGLHVSLSTMDDSQDKVPSISDHPMEAYLIKMSSIIGRHLLPAFVNGSTFNNLSIELQEIQKLFMLSHLIGHPNHSKEKALRVT